MRVMVTAIGGDGHGDQILKALRLLTPPKYYIIGTDINPNCPQRALVDSFEILPPASDGAYLSSLVETCERQAVEVLFHGCEAEMMVISKNRKIFEDLGITLGMNSASVIQLCTNKFATARFIEETGAFMPRTELFSEVDLPAFAKVDYFPVVIKPASGGGASSNVLLAQTYDQLVAAFEYLTLTHPNSHFVVQEYIGTSTSEYTVGILHDKRGQYIGGLALRRDLNSSLSVRERIRNLNPGDSFGEWLIVSSGISQGLLDRFPEVVDPCRRLAEAMGSQGPLNFQCRVHRGKVGIFEINPRLSGTTSLRAMAGFNEPDLMISRNRLSNQELHVDYFRLPVWISRRLTEYVSLSKHEDSN